MIRKRATRFSTLVVLVALVATGCTGPTSAPTASPEAHDIHGHIFYAGVIGFPGDKCGGPPTLASGSEVDLTDGANATLGVAHLVEASDSGSGSPQEGTSLYTCHETFTFNAVKKSDFYKVSIGGGNAVTFSYDDLKSAGWTMTLHQ